MEAVRCRMKRGLDSPVAKKWMDVHWEEVEDGSVASLLVEERRDNALELRAWSSRRCECLREGRKFGTASRTGEPLTLIDCPLQTQSCVDIARELCRRLSSSSSQTRSVFRFASIRRKRPFPPCCAFYSLPHPDEVSCCTHRHSCSKLQCSTPLSRLCDAMTEAMCAPFAPPPPPEDPQSSAGSPVPAPTASMPGNGLPFQPRAKAYCQ